MAGLHRDRRIALAEPVQDEQQSANCGLLRHRRRAGGSESLQHVENWSSEAFHRALQRADGQRRAHRAELAHENRRWRGGDDGDVDVFRDDDADALVVLASENELNVALAVCRDHADRVPV
jgi:hypothetical protein